MKERLLQLLDLEHLTPSKFADLIGVQRSSVSHILSDRNKPSFDFLKKTLKTFPGLKADWLMLGEGPMYEQMGREGADLFSQDTPDIPEDLPVEQLEDADSEILSNDESSHEAIDNQAIPENTVAGQRTVIQVMLFFDDNTFVTYKPSQ